MNKSKRLVAWLQWESTCFASAKKPCVQTPVPHTQKKKKKEKEKEKLPRLYYQDHQEKNMKVII
jgi:hypothetical protein